MKYIEYKGLRYTLNRSGYYSAPAKHAKIKGMECFLHREIFKDHWGEIPHGWHVHHIDGNNSNNAPENLVAVPQYVHQSYHNGSGGTPYMRMGWFSNRGSGR